MVAGRGMGLSLQDSHCMASDTTRFGYIPRQLAYPVGEIESGLGVGLRVSDFGVRNLVVQSLWEKLNKV